MNKAIRQQIESLNSAMSRTNAAYDRFARQQGLHYNSLMILEVLYGSDAAEGCTQKQICDKWMLPKQTVNMVCSEFKAKGYISLRTHAGDKRERRIVLTQAGRGYAAHICDKLHEIEERVCLALGAELCAACLQGNEQYCRSFEQEIEHETPTGKTIHI